MQRAPQTISFWRGVLPHWEVVDGRYFVTVRRANSLPRSKVDELSLMLKGAGRADYLEKSRAYFRQMEAWLDADRSANDLCRDDIARCVVDSIAHHQAMGHWRVLAYAIMPNHLHLFFACGCVPMSEMVERFKRYTGRAANSLLGREGQRFWQREWFDHWSRSVQEDDKIVSYIRNNPVMAGLVPRVEDWPWVQ